MISVVVPAWLLFAIMAVTCGQFSSTASAYQTTMSAATMVSTGMTRPRGETSAPKPPGIATSVIRMAGLQAFAHAMRQSHGGGGFPRLEIAIGRQRAVDHFDDAPRARAHHHDAGREQHRFVDRMGHEDHGLAGLAPD